MSKIGIVGGTFNPIHIGHLCLAEYARTEFELDEVWLMPTGCSYMKQNDLVLPGETRLAMVECAIQGNPYFHASDLEIKREGYTYTYETLSQLTKQYPEHSFFYICGADCLFTMEKWKLPQEIFRQCTVIAAYRSGSSMEEMEAQRIKLLEKYKANISLMQFIHLEISSTDIRARIKAGKSVRYLLPKSVCDYIENNHLYC